MLFQSSGDLVTASETANAPLLELSTDAAFFVRLLQPSDHLHGPPLDLLWHAHILLSLQAPDLDTVSQVGSHIKSRVEGDNHPCSAGHVAFDEAQGMVCFLDFNEFSEIKLNYFVE